MNKTGKILTIILLGVWVIAPDIVPGLVDDAVAAILMVNQITSLTKANTTEIE